MGRTYLLKVVLFYLTLIVLITLNRFFGGAISEEFQFLGNLALVLIAAASILILLLRQLKSSRAMDKNATAAARAELLKEIAKKIVNSR